MVGPICESGDVLGADRRLPEAQEGDVMLIAQAGAYGKVMASHYNLREEADEVVLDRAVQASAAPHPSLSPEGRGDRFPERRIHRVTPAFRGEGWGEGALCQGLTSRMFQGWNA